MREVLRFCEKNPSVGFQIYAFLYDLFISLFWANLAFSTSLCVWILLLHSFGYGLPTFDTAILLGLFLTVLPACIGPLWLLLYLISGLILKFFRKLDLGFSWFNKKFDIEHRPLQSVGLVAGTIVALSYWFVVLIMIASSMYAK